MFAGFDLDLNRLFFGDKYEYYQKIGKSLYEDMETEIRSGV